MANRHRWEIWAEYPTGWALLRGQPSCGIWENRQAAIDKAKSLEGGDLHIIVQRVCQLSNVADLIEYDSKKA